MIKCNNISQLSVSDSMCNSSISTGSLEVKGIIIDYELEGNQYIFTLALTDDEGSMTGQQATGYIPKEEFEKNVLKKLG